jgi:tripartite-type tricarboxylate transporter receptor subunit TctC
MPRVAVLLLAILAVAAPSTAAQAQAWPDKPIRFIVPSPPGGGTDSLTRLLANKLGETLKWQMVVDNRPGAGGNLGLDIAAKAAPDGYTLVMGESSNLAINPYLYKKLPFDPAKDVTPVALVGTVPLVLVVAANAPFDSVKALVEAAKKKQLTFASSGNGTVGHLVGEMWKRAVAADLLHVPYKGAGPVMPDLLTGRVDLFFNNCAAVRKFVEGGQVKALAVTGRERNRAFPRTPTVLESGVAPLEMDSWIGFFAGARTPAPVLERLRADIAAVIAEPEVTKQLEQDGGRIFRMPIGEAEAYVKSEIERWRALIPKAGVSLD